jgi:hypothetical protein
MSHFQRRLLIAGIVLELTHYDLERTGNMWNILNDLSF